MVQLAFHGAARCVTGSKYLLEADGARVLIDCGLFQGLKPLRLKNWDAPPFDPRSVDAVVLTHAHLDHVGYLPRLVKQGFQHKIHCTPATSQLAEIILLDSAKCQEYDAAFANKKGYSKHQPALPLYDGRDVERTVRLFREQPRQEWFCPVEPFWMRFADAGHLLGSNHIEVEVRNRSVPLRIVFSGDIGRYDGPLYHDPAPPPACDYLICESTYGDRDHPEQSLLDALAEVVKRSVARGGVMLMAAFAVGRSQQLIYLLQVLKSEGRIPDLPIYLDSPMAVNATQVYRQFADDHDLAEGDLDNEHPVLGGPHVHLVRETDASKALNRIQGPAVILSSSGMICGSAFPIRATPSSSADTWLKARAAGCCRTARKRSACSAWISLSAPPSKPSPDSAATPIVRDCSAGWRNCLLRRGVRSSRTGNLRAPTLSPPTCATPGAGTWFAPSSARVFSSIDGRCGPVVDGFLRTS
jgi:metallo-beta-lactamase family protein